VGALHIIKRPDSSALDRDRSTLMTGLLTLHIYITSVITMVSELSRTQVESLVGLVSNSRVLSELQEKRMVKAILFYFEIKRKINSKRVGTTLYSSYL